MKTCVMNALQNLDIKIKMTAFCAIVIPLHDKCFKPGLL